MSQFNTLDLEYCDNGVTTLWLARTVKNNAFNAEMIAELITALTQLEADPSVRVLVLRGRGKHFSAGADLEWMKASAQLDYKANLTDANKLGELMYRLYRLPIPTICVVQGAAFGGAVGLIACCDIAIGAFDAQLSLSEVRIGLVPAVISPYVVQAIGLRATRRYALTAERFSGETAQQVGLFAQACKVGELNAALQTWLGHFALNSPQAMRVAKSLLLEVGTGDPTVARREHLEHCIASLRVTEQAQEGLQAFFDKRTPNWITS